MYKCRKQASMAKSSLSQVEVFCAPCIPEHVYVYKYKYICVLMSFSVLSSWTTRRRTSGNIYTCYIYIHMYNTIQYNPYAGKPRPVGSAGASPPTPAMQQG